SAELFGSEISGVSKVFIERKAPTDRAQVNLQAASSKRQAARTWIFFYFYFFGWVPPTCAPRKIKNFFVDLVIGLSYN
ncbi:hypothetical protein, partial [Vibrio owensii]|uniref:hypothetical protein n=1 Tax=Vibrio owensii TaxID=696485 RepID=UPI00406953A4